MRTFTVLAGLFLLAGSHVAVSADKPVVVAAVNAKAEAAKVPAAKVSVAVTKETYVPEGSLEKFGSVGLPQ